MHLFFLVGCEHNFADLSAFSSYFARNFQRHCCTKCSSIVRRLRQIGGFWVVSVRRTELLQRYISITSHYITFRHFKRHLHLKWSGVHQQLHVILNTKWWYVSSGTQKLVKKARFIYFGMDSTWDGCLSSRQCILIFKQSLLFMNFLFWNHIYEGYLRQ